jgi:hypothetical protein
MRYGIDVRLITMMTINRYPMVLGRGIRQGKKGYVQSCKFYLTNKLIQNAPNSLTLCSHQILNFVPIKFPMGCQRPSQGPNAFHNMFPIAPHFVPQMICPTLTSWNLHSWANIGAYMFLCLEWIFLHWGVLKVSDLFCDGPIKVAHCK